MNRRRTIPTLIALAIALLVGSAARLASQPASPRHSVGGDTVASRALGGRTSSASGAADSGGDTITAGGATKPARPWYDTLTVTRPRYAYASPSERLALAAFTAISIPIGLGVSVLTLLPPSVNVLTENGASHTGIAFSAGVGIARDTTPFIFFPEYRFQFEGGYYFQRERRAIVRASINVDKPIAPIDRRKFFWLGAAAGAGVSTDFRSTGPYVEGWLGLINPMGIRYLSLFPMHNYGLRGRVGYDPIARAAWYEFGITATSTFWF